MDRTSILNTIDGARGQRGMAVSCYACVLQMAMRPSTRGVCAHVYTQVRGADSVRRRCGLAVGHGGVSDRVPLRHACGVAAGSIQWPAECSIECFTKCSIEWSIEWSIECVRRVFRRMLHRMLHRMFHRMFHRTGRRAGRRQRYRVLAGSEPRLLSGMI